MTKRYQNTIQELKCMYSKGIEEKVFPVFSGRIETMCSFFTPPISHVLPTYSSSKR